MLAFFYPPSKTSGCNSMTDTASLRLHELSKEANYRLPVALFLGITNRAVPARLKLVSFRRVLASELWRSLSSPDIDKLIKRNKLSPRQDLQLNPAGRKHQRNSPSPDPPSYHQREVGSQKKATDGCLTSSVCRELGCNLSISNPALGTSQQR